MPRNFPSGELYFSGIKGEIRNLDFSFYRPVEWKTKKPIFNIEILNSKTRTLFY